MSKLRRPSTLITAMILVVAAGGIYRLYGILAGSSDGTVSVGQVQTEEVAETSDRLPAENPYSTFNYGSFFTETKVDKPVAPVLFNHSFVKQQFSPWSMAVQVTRLPSGSMADSGTYNYRSKAVAQYTKTQRTIGTHTVTIFSNKAVGQFDQAAYFQKGSLLASITLMGGTSQDTEAMQAELDTVITNWQWRQ